MCVVLKYNGFKFSELCVKKFSNMPFWDDIRNTPFF